MLFRIVGGFAIVASLALALQLGKAHGTIQRITRERDAATKVVEILTGMADKICEAAGQPFRPDGVKDAAKWGDGCLVRVRNLRQIEADVQEATAQASRDAIATQQRKTEADTLAARKAEAKRQKARRNMESVNARITNDDVGPDWFAGLNELGGLLRPTLSAPAEAAGAGAADQGHPAGRTDAVS